MSPTKIIFRLFTLLFITLWFCSEISATSTKGLAAMQTDSLTTKAEDSVTIVRMINEALLKIEENNTPQAEAKFFNTIEKAIDLARKSGQLLLAGKEINKAGQQLRNEARYPLAIWLHKKSIKIGKETKNIRHLIFSYNDLGVVFRRIDSYQKAMNYHLKALRLATQIHDSISRAIAVNSIGNVNLMMGNYDKALQYFKQSLRLEQSRNNPIGIAINLNNIAHVYEQKGYLTKALKYYELSLDINRRIHSKRGIAICSNDIASLLNKLGKYKDALIFSKSALQLSKEIKDYDNLAYAYIKTGALYSAMKNYEKAFQYLEPGIALAKKIRARSTLEDGYNTLFNTFMAMKKYKEAIKYLKLKQAYHDSLLNLDVRKSIARLQIQFDTERQQSQMQLQQQKTKIAMLQLKKQKYLLYFAWSAFAILLIVLTFVSFYLFNKNKQNRLLLEKTRKIEEAEKELKESNKALQQAIEKAENSTRAKTNFLANISHEIRTPLNSVIGFSDLLFAMATDEKQKNYLRTIKSSGESLLCLINDILDLSKIEEGNIDLEFKEIDIRKIVDDVISIFSLEASSKGLHLTTDIEENVPSFLIFEEARLRQILLNLVGNGIKFTHQGSVTIHIYTKQESEKGKITLIIEVEDTGPGISPEDQEIIFMPFHQAQTSEKAKGAGLGLAITQRMIKAMNGEIKLESTLGKGSLFRVIFHNVQVSIKTENKSTKQEIHQDKKTKSCLFINQPHPLRDELKQVLIYYGFNVEDVGLNLSQAKKNITNIRLIIFCCLDDEILKNAQNIFEKENLDNQHLFLILNIKESYSIDKSKATVIQLFNKSEKEVISALHKFIQHYEEDEHARHLFYRDESLPDETFFSKLQHLFQEDFNPAFHTKMFDKIEAFVQHVQQLAIEYHLASLRTYAEELEYYLKNFDIVSIEKQMRIFKKAYEIIFNNK